MNTTRPWRLRCLAGLGLALSTLSGCQTWVGGMTLQFAAPEQLAGLRARRAVRRVLSGAVTDRL